MDSSLSHIYIKIEMSGLAFLPRPLSFVLPPPRSRELIFAGLYPPATAQSADDMINNRTTVEIKKIVGDRVLPTWIDLIPFAPPANQSNRDVDMAAIAKHVTNDPSVADTLLDRLIDRAIDTVAAGVMRVPVIYVCGEIVNAALRLAVAASSRLVLERTIRHEHGVVLYTISDQSAPTYVAMLWNHYHPSAALMSHGYDVVEAILRNGFLAATITVEILNDPASFQKQLLCPMFVGTCFE